ncbi:MAG: bifunctional riboflavin kinase/FAD synthetase [Thiohalocapsa sp.]|jgi:riboflavin kinase/FMN adenylyltransferase|uniref:bifunctional riboflavin kinase/FAD synthetase n=1 Tax=Thiohalocapsa sp. TaxID=2497641 RepID=UPI0025FDD2C7|nr:bifunctional riboflavin kinase/FAD synthetase [Thiohalocapsa sp.]
MRLIRGLHNLRPQDRGCVATIGNFDGVHLGHRTVFRRLLQRGHELGLPATVITFEPQPMEYFQPDAAPARLTRLREKLAAIRADGIHRVMLLEFGHKLAAMPADAFIEQLLVHGLGVRFLLVGDDFRFGRNRGGDFQLLQAAGAQRGFEVENLHTITQGEERISSTRVREALARGELDQARHLLGRHYAMRGRVAHGDKRGRSIGFPTANLPLHRRVSPLSGVYAVAVRDLDGERLPAARPEAGVERRPGLWPAVANVGHRPTVDGQDVRLEVHLFDFDGDLYGAHLEVEFRLRLRGEQRFESFEALQAQIGRDAAAARAYLGVS